jgi:hypothetical protein
MILARMCKNKNEYYFDMIKPNCDFVQDVNDHAPRFVSPSGNMTLRLLENTTIGSANLNSNLTLKGNYNFLSVLNVQKKEIRNSALFLCETIVFFIRRIYMGAAIL